MGNRKADFLLGMLLLCAWPATLVGCTYDYDRFSSVAEGTGGTATGDRAQGGTASTEQDPVSGGTDAVGGSNAIDTSGSGGSDGQGGSSSLQLTSAGGTVAQGGTSGTVSTATGGSAALGGTSAAIGSSFGGTSSSAAGGDSHVAGSSGLDAGQGGSSQQNTATGGSATGGNATTSTASSTVAGCRYASDCGSSSEAKCENLVCVCSGTVCQPGQTCRRHGSAQECI